MKMLLVDSLEVLMCDEPPPLLHVPIQRSPPVSAKDYERPLRVNVYRLRKVHPLDGYALYDYVRTEAR